MGRSSALRGASHRRHLRAIAPGVLAVVALVGVALYLGIDNRSSWLWIDEGISVGMATHPLGQLPHLLRQDGSPPLYYALLHVWMALGARSDAQVHTLSLLFSLATVPAAVWAGWSLFGRRTGLLVGLLAATNPFLLIWASEARMYSLAILLSVLVAATFLHAFAFRRRRYLAPFAVCLALLLYTHNWGLFVALGAAAALVPCLLAAPDRRRMLGDAVLGFGAAGLLYLPWVPVLAYQARNTGAPWSYHPEPHEILTALERTFTDGGVLVPLVVVTVAGLAALMARFRQPPAPAAVALAVMVAVTVLAAWINAQFNLAWSERYFTLLTGPLLLLAAVGLSRTHWVGVVAVVVVAFLWAHPVGRLTGARPRPPRDSRSRVYLLATGVAPHLARGDLVVALDMEEGPILYHYLPRGLRFANATGPVRDPSVLDWRRATERLERATPEKSLTPLVDALPVGHQVLAVCPPGDEAANMTPWFRLMFERCARWRQAIGDDPRLRPVDLSGDRRLAPEIVRSLLLVRKVASGR